MPPSTQYSRPFDNDDITCAIKNMKIGKTNGYDGIHPDFLIHCGQYARAWLANFYTNLLQNGQIPHSLKHARFVEILKPG